MSDWLFFGVIDWFWHQTPPRGRLARRVRNWPPSAKAPDVFGSQPPKKKFYEEDAALTEGTGPGIKLKMSSGGSPRKGGMVLARVVCCMCCPGCPDWFMRTLVLVLLLVCAPMFQFIV